MLRAMASIFLLSLIAAALFAFGAGVARAHGNPEVSVAPNPASTGGTITIEGKEFEESDEISLILEGISGTIALGTAAADEEGSFHVEVALPAEASAGSYRLRAQGSDAVALADLRILVARGGAQPAAHEATLGFRREGPRGEVIALAVLLGVFAVAGMALLFMGEKDVRVRG